MRALSHRRPLAWVFILVFGCAACTTGTAAIKDATRATISTKLVEGMSTKDQVMAMFGEPTQRVASNSFTTWLYTYGAAQDGVQNFIPGVSMFSSTNASQGKVLMVDFDLDGVLLSYTFTATNNNVHRGI